MNHKSIIGLNFFLIVLSGVLLSCKDDLVDTGPIDIVFPDSNISYSRYVQPLFNRGCAIPGGCHAGEAPAADLSFESYQQATDRVGIIVPTDPNASYIIAKIEGRAAGSRMPPPPRSALSENQIKGMRRWILEGAQNN